MHKQFQGTYTAIVTPFTKDNKIDWPVFEQLVERQIAGGVEGIVFVGTTGESPTISQSEHIQIMNWAVNLVNGRKKVIIGTGSNNTQHNIELAKEAEKAGADAQLCVNPYYNKPTQEGLYLHFKAIADSTSLPVIVYNIKSRTGVNVETPTLIRLAQHPTIVAVKEASGDLPQMMDVIRKVPAHFSVLIGDDGLSLPFMAAGGDGLISVISNVIPKTISGYIRACLNSDFNTARKMFFDSLDVMNAAFIESSPIPVKEMLGIMNLCNPELRLPLSRASENSLIFLKSMINQIRELEK